MRRVLVFLLLGLLSMPLFAQAGVGSAAVDTWFVRPTGACANNGDGLAYGCAASAGATGAFKGFSNIIWTATTGVDDADTLYVCGAHLTELSPAASGASGAPITIRGNCPSDPGTIVTSGQGVLVDAIEILQQSWITIRDFTMLTGTRHAIHWFNFVATTYSGLSIIDNIIDNRAANSSTNACYGIAVLSSGDASYTNVTITGNRIIGTSFACAGGPATISSGIIVQRSSTVLIENNYVQDTSGVGISFAGTSAGPTSILRNTLTNNRNGGVKIQNAGLGCPSNVVLAGNLMINNSSWSIQIIDLNTSVIANNTAIQFNDGNKTGGGPTYGAFIIWNLFGCPQTGNTYLNNILTSDYSDGVAVNYVQTRAAFQAGNTWNGNVFYQRGAFTTLFGFLPDTANNVTTSNFSTWQASHLKDLSIQPTFLDSTACTSEATVAGCKASNWRLAVGSPLHLAGVSTTFCKDVDGHACNNPPDIGAYQFGNTDTTAPAAPTRLTIR